MTHNESCQTAPTSTLSHSPSLLKAALEYAAKGWPVFPLHSVRYGACTCGKAACSSPGKHPRTHHGLKDATNDPHTIERWWTRWPDANIGVVTGSTSGIVAIDLDTDKGGLESWTNLARRYEAVETLTAITGSGGQHLVFQAPQHVVLRGTAGQIALGVDTRAEGGNIVAPPSLHISGRRYEWLNSVATAPIPKWLLDIWPRSHENAERRQRMTVDGVIPEGSRNVTLASLAGTMRRRGMGQEAIEAALLAENSRRCAPPLPEAEVLRIARSISTCPSQISRETNSPYQIVSLSPTAARLAPDLWPQPLEEEAFYGLAGEVVRTMQPHTEADPVALLINFLTAFGNAVGRGPHAIAEADRHGINLFAIQVGETAKGRKGSAWGHIRELFQRVDPVWTGSCIKGGLSSGEGLAWHVRDSIDKTEPVKERGRYTGEYQTVAVDQGVEDKRLLCYEPEFASVLKVIVREGNTLSALVRQAWDSGTLRTLTKSNPTLATDAHISILGHITKEEVLRHLTDTEAANGFANRYLWLCVRRSKYLPEGGGTPDYHRLVQSLHEAFKRGKGMGRLERDEEAREAWAEIYKELSEGKRRLFGAITARAEAQVLRLSVVYAALDGSDAIRLPHLMAALAVWEYCEASARYIFGDATGDPYADRILESLRLGELTRTQINALFQRHVSSARIAQALYVLLTTKRAICERRDSEGRPVEVWMAAS